MPDDDLPGRAARNVDRTRLADIQARLRSSDDPILPSSLIAERAAIQQRLDAYIYPILSIPNEITSEILCHCLPCYPECPRLLGPGSPMELAQVCRQWRLIAYATPALWRAIELFKMEPNPKNANKMRLVNVSFAPDVSLAKTWLQRSRSMPLSIVVHCSRTHFIEEQIRLVLPILLAHRSRWEYTSLHVGGALSAEQRIEGHMPLLKELEIIVQSQSLITDALGTLTAPQLATAFVQLYENAEHRLVSAFLSPLVPWAQLTSLSLNYLQPFFMTRILRETRCLRRLLIDFGKADSPGKVCTGTTSLDKLEILLVDAMYSNIPNADINEFLLRLRAPALQQFHMDPTLLFPQTDEDDFATPLVALIKSMGCRLKRLSIARGDHIQLGVWRLLLPDITSVGNHHLILHERATAPRLSDLGRSQEHLATRDTLDTLLAAFGPSEWPSTRTDDDKMSSRPTVVLQPSVSTTVVTTTTTTTTTYAPITLPPLPTPVEPTDPKEYPLLHATLPSNLRKFPLVFPGGTRATFRDGDDESETRADDDDERDSHGEGWRMLRRDDPPEPVVGLAEAVERYGKKRAWGDGGESPSRKKPRPPPSPPGSRQGSPFEPDLALTTLLTLPSLVSHFSALPPALQSHFLLTLLRHSPLPVLRNVHSVLTPTLARDFLTLLPPELGSHILSFLPFPTLARAARVSKSWRALIDADPLVWTSLLKSYGMFWGSEEPFLRAHRRLPYPHRSLFQSRYLTQARWADSPAPVHRSFLAHGSSVVTCLILSKGRVISASDDHSIHVYDPLSGEQKHALQGHEGGVWALAATGDMLVSGSTDRTVRIWDLVSGRCTHVFGGHTSTVRCLAIVHPEWIEMENGRREKWPKRPLIVTGSRDHTLRVWTLPKPGDPPYSCFDEGDPEDADDNPYHRHHLEGHEHAVRALAARGRTLVSGSYDCTVRVWDLITGECRWVLGGHTQKVYSVVLDPMRHQACSGSMDGTVRVWDLKTGRCAHTLTGHTSLVGLLGLSPRTLVSAAADSTLRVWDPSSGALLHTLAAHTGAITCFQHDEFKVLSGSDGTLKMWNLRDGSVVRDLLTGITGVWQVVFEGRWCVAASNQMRGGAVQTVLDVWDFAGEGEDWVGEPPGGVYDEPDESDDELELDDADGGAFRRRMDVEMRMVVEDDEDDQRDEASVDAAMAMDEDQDIVLRSRSASQVADGIEVDEQEQEPADDDVDLVAFCARSVTQTDEEDSGGINTYSWAVVV
ncbi:WD40 repeat-like protein [Mycena chlorophos]|uniref:WD40 repeat-like protein n=1 Tax=Mycena chlorophos TaxID=658473 RepID=A0A8H6TR91_MYCCL|nr:WD40 repeat-like protein [Mycena chlorophos]